MPVSDAELIDHLQVAIADLRWMSESDYPFQAVYWEHQALETLTLPQLLLLTEHDQETPVAVCDFEVFFNRVTQPQSWHGPEDQERVHRYQHLVETLYRYLTNLVVYQVGEIELDIYIVGQTFNNTVAGISTRAIAT